MLRLRSLFVVSAFLLCAGCSKKESVPQPSRISSQPALLPASGMGKTPDASLVQAPAAELKPLAEGKRVRIDKLEVPPLEITVPSGFKLTIGGGDLLPRAYLQGPEWQVVVREPEAGFFTLKQEIGMLLRSSPETKIIHAQEGTDGFVIIYRGHSTEPSTYGTVVSRPALEVECVAWGLDSLADAERVASMCLSLGPARGKRLAR